MISNKALIELKRVSKALEANAVADKTKEAEQLRKERLALEKVSGGKKKLNAASKILADAEKEAAEIVAASKAEGIRLSRAAMDEIRTGTEALQEKQREYDKEKAALDRQKKTNRLKASELENAALAVQGRENAANERDTILDQRDGQITAREREVAEREAEIARYNAWAAARPA